MRKNERTDFVGKDNDPSVDPLLKQDKPLTETELEVKKAPWGEPKMVIDTRTGKRYTPGTKLPENIEQLVTPEVGEFYDKKYKEQQHVYRQLDVADELERERQRERHRKDTEKEKDLARQPRVAPRPGTERMVPARQVLTDKDKARMRQEQMMMQHQEQYTTVVIGDKKPPKPKKRVPRQMKPVHIMGRHPKGKVPKKKKPVRKPFPARYERLIIKTRKGVMVRWRDKKSGRFIKDPRKN